MKNRITFCILILMAGSTPTLIGSMALKLDHKKVVEVYTAYNNHTLDLYLQQYRTQDARHAFAESIERTVIGRAEMALEFLGMDLHSLRMIRESLVMLRLIDAFTTRGNQRARDLRHQLVQFLSKNQVTRLSQLDQIINSSKPKL